MMTDTFKARQVRIRPVFPISDDGVVDFEALDCIPQGPDCNVTDDTELGIDVIEIIGEESRILFPTTSSMPFLVIHIKNMVRFLSFEVIFKDTKNINRQITFSNKRSTAVIDGDVANLPLEIGEGWQYINLNIADMSSRCFGTEPRSVKEICINGSCRVAKIFFQEECYADVELPPFLRVVNDE
jgi:hypothetical protein